MVDRGLSPCNCVLSSRDVRLVHASDFSRVTLEDGSRWDMDPRAHFSVAEWQADVLVTVRRSSDDPLFPFNVSNTTRDDGAVGKRLSR